MADVVTSHNSDQHRYEARVDGELAGFIEYRQSVGLVNLVHTEVDDRFEGQGIGSKLARFALDDLRADGSHRVLATCPFIVSWIGKHPDYADVAEVPSAD
ncbi:GNAT family N-acetyltransferase [Nocardioides caricicola]|uniref:GNAT family N-acetyltransferase n=1 Tax=Nocardioides caricicola TaxID=634770 RepID=UPI0031F11BAC